MIDKLDMLLALARERHFGRAAEACGVTQPTLSAGLRALEASLGTRLVNRSSRFVGLTPEGERVLGWARRIVGDAAAMRQEIASPGEPLAGVLRIAAIPTALPAVSHLTAPLQRRYPGVTVTVLSRPSGEMLGLLRDLEIDAGIGYLDHEPLGPMRTVPLYTERYCLLTPLAGPLGRRTSVAWEEVGQVPLCLLTPDMQNRRIIDERLRAAGVTAAPTVVSNSLIALLAHVRTGQWSTILPPLLVGTLGLPQTLAAIPLVKPALAHAVGLIVPRSDPATRLVAGLLDVAGEAALTLGHA